VPTHLYTKLLMPYSSVSGCTCDSSADSWPCLLLLLLVVSGSSVAERSRASQPGA
jgi:hypothetical protein